MKQISTHGVEKVSSRESNKSHNKHSGRTTKARRPRHTSPSRDLRLQRLKQQCMPRTAALDTRKAYDLGDLIEPKVRTGNNLLSSLNFLEPDFEEIPDEVQESKEKVSADRPDTASSQQSRARTPPSRPSSSATGEFGQHLNQDEELAALILSSDKGAQTGVINSISNARLHGLAQRFTKDDWEHVRVLATKRAAEIVKVVRQQMIKKQQHYDALGIFHPDANKRRAEGWLQVTVRSRLKYSSLVNEVLESILLADSRTRESTPANPNSKANRNGTRDELTPDSQVDRQIRRRIRDRTESVQQAVSTLDYKAPDWKTPEERVRRMNMAVEEMHLPGDLNTNLLASDAQLLGSPELITAVGKSRTLAKIALMQSPNSRPTTPLLPEEMIDVNVEALGDASLQEGKGKQQTSKRRGSGYNKHINGARKTNSKNEQQTQQECPKNNHDAKIPSAIRRKERDEGSNGNFPKKTTISQEKLNVSFKANKKSVNPRLHKGTAEVLIISHGTSKQLLGTDEEENSKKSKNMEMHAIKCKGEGSNAHSVGLNKTGRDVSRAIAKESLQGLKKEQNVKLLRMSDDSNKRATIETTPPKIEANIESNKQDVTNNSNVTELNGQTHSDLNARKNEKDEEKEGKIEQNIGEENKEKEEYVEEGRVRVLTLDSFKRHGGKESMFVNMYGAEEEEEDDDYALGYDVVHPIEEFKRTRALGYAQSEVKMRALRPHILVGADLDHPTPISPNRGKSRRSTSMRRNERGMRTASSSSGERALMNSRESQQSSQTSLSYDSSHTGTSSELESIVDTNNEEVEVEQRQSRVTPPTSRQSRRTKRGALNVVESDEPYISELQHSLERLFNALEMPLGLRLQLILKYSGSQHVMFFHDVLEQWNQAADLVVLREAVCKRLRDFTFRDHDVPIPELLTDSQVEHLIELEAHVSHASTLAVDAPTWLGAILNSLDVKCQNAAAELQDNYQETLTYRGNLYSRVLKMDRTKPPPFTGNKMWKRFNNVLLTE